MATELIAATAGGGWGVSPYEVSLLVVGGAMLLSAWLPRLLAGRELTLPIVFLGGGAALFQLPLWLPDPSPMAHGAIAERLTELAVLVALMGAGLKLDRRPGLRAWGATWRLLAITMPLTIAAGALMGWWLLGLGVAGAVLLGAVLAPTDPVLASDVQVNAPGKGGEDEIRFSLTSEAGLNDGLAFPFVYLALALAAAGTPGAAETADAAGAHEGAAGASGASAGGWELWARWLAVDVGYRIAVGVAGGWLVGWAIAGVLFRPPASGADPVASAMEGSLALAATFVAYGAVELAHGYGFLAVFVAACTIRAHERHHAYHEALHTFTEDVERVLLAVLLVLFGGAAVGLLTHLTWGGAAFAVLLVAVVRPAAGYLGLLGRDEPWKERLAISFFGIRGIGSLYYLAYAANHASFEGLERLWATVTATILLSALVHGVTATPVLRRLDRARG